MELFTRAAYSWSTIVTLALINLAVKSIRGDPSTASRCRGIHSHWRRIAEGDRSSRARSAGSSEAPLVYADPAVMYDGVIQLPAINKCFFTEEQICLFIQVCEWSLSTLTRLIVSRLAGAL
jgi:hypothetical protein